MKNSTCFVSDAEISSGKWMTLFNTVSMSVDLIGFSIVLKVKLWVESSFTVLLSVQILNNFVSLVCSEVSYVELVWRRYILSSPVPLMSLIIAFHTMLHGCLTYMSLLSVCSLSLQKNFTNVVSARVLPLEKLSVDIVCTIVTWIVKWRIAHHFAYAD